MGAEKRTAGKKASKASGKKMGAAMKKKGVGLFAPKTLSPALAAICGGKSMPRTEGTKKIWVYIKKNKLNDGRTIKPDAVEGGLPGCKSGHVEARGLREQALVLRPWASPGHLADEFRRRAGLSSRDLTSSTRVTSTILADSSVLRLFSQTSHACMSGGEFREES